MKDNALGGSPKVGLLIVGHGTRQAVGLAEFYQIAEQVRELAKQFDVEPCFLEIAEPSIAEGMRRLLERGVRRLVVSPLLLFAAGHAKRDIPEAVCAALVGASDVEVAFARPLECHPEVVALSARRFAEANADTEATATFLLLVGRGSSEPSAIAEMHRFAGFLRAREPIGQLEVCFVTIASPSLDEGLMLAAASKFTRIVVQPHLLFAGQVADEISEKVADYARRFPDKQWVMADHFGAAAEIAAAVVDLCHTARAGEIGKTDTGVAT